MIRELDDVSILAHVVCDDGAAIPAGTEGIAAIWGDGAAFEVEFSEPEVALATISAAGLRRVGCHAS